MLSAKSFVKAFIACLLASTVIIFLDSPDYKRLYPIISFGTQLSHSTSIMEYVFRVKIDDIILDQSDVVCVSGDIEELGKWMPKVHLKLNLTDDNYYGRHWKGSITLPLDKEEIRYRYFIATKTNHESLKIRFWETNIEPRKANISNAHSHNEIHTFGFYNNNRNIQKGWLIDNEALVQLKLFNNPITLWKSYENKLNLKVLKQKHIDGVEDTILDDEVELSIMNRDECSFKMQNKNGRRINNKDNIVFQSRLSLRELNGFRFYLNDPSDNDKQIGNAYLSSSIFEGVSSGAVKLPINSLTENKIIGEIAVEFLVVHSMENHECSMELCYVNYWNKERGTLEMGHRGCGTSFSKINKTLSDVRENTIGSLKLAGNNGADFVEFDVLLSKDLIPVIYHDFYLCISSAKKEQLEQPSLLEVPVMNLTLQELKNAAVYHVSEKSSDGRLNPKTFRNDGEEDFQPFPTLKQLFHAVDPHIGFNVEIKWGLTGADGKEDLPNQINMNLYLDTILKVVFENAGNRRIVFSCFHPDVCTMVRWKQNKYPVLLLTQGKTKRYAPYKDPRTKNIPEAINYAISSGILGIDVQTEEILDDNSTVSQCLNSNLIMVCWGEDNNDLQNRDLLKRLGVHGIIYDRIHQFNPGKKNIFMRENELK